MVAAVPQILVSGDYQSQTFKNLSSLREKTECCDITLKVQDTVIRAHKVILAACSQYFNFMFTGNVTEHTKEEILLNDLQPEAVSALIEYVYSGAIVVTEESIVNILTTADFLQIQSAKLECLDFLLKNIRPSNCVKLKQLANVISAATRASIYIRNQLSIILEKHYFNEFEKKLNNFIRWNFTEVIKSQDFLELPADKIKDFLGDENFDLSESNIEKGIAAWIRHDRISRDNLKYDLMKVSVEHIRKLKETTLNIYDSNRQRRVYIINSEPSDLAVTFYDLNNSALHRVPSRPGSEFFLPTLHNDSILMLNKNDAKYAKYDLDQETWTLVQPFIKHMRLFRQHFPLSIQTSIGKRINYFTRRPFFEYLYSGACSFNDRIYLIADHTKRFYSYNVERNVLYPECDLLHERSYPGIARDEHCIYVCGGGTNAVERLDYRTNKWKSVACLPVDTISRCTATSLGSSLFCTPHYTEGFFQFDKRLGMWIQKSDIPKSKNEPNKWCFSTISSTDDAVYAANSCGLHKYSVAGDYWTTLIKKNLGGKPTCICYVPQ